MKSNMTIREIRMLVRRTINEMKLGLSSSRPSSMEQPRYLPRPTLLRFEPDENALQKDRVSRSGSNASDPLMGLYDFMYGDDSDEESVEDYEIAQDLEDP